METETPAYDPIQEVKVLGTRRPLQKLNLNVKVLASPAKKSLTTKPKQLSLKPMTETQEKLSVVSENVSEWPSLDKEQPTPSLQSETEESQQQAPIFRQHVDLDDIDDMLMLKRANPVYDSDDEDEDLLRSPSKRQRTNGPSQLFWNEQLSEDDSERFTLPVH